MAEKKRAKKSGGFTAAEKAAMRERARELKAEKNRESGEKELLAKVKEMKKSDRAMAKKIHEIVSKNAPKLVPRTWYGMPAYSDQDGKVVCFFRSAEKFESRYATFGFNDAAKIDSGEMWPTSFALLKIGEAEAKKITTLVKRAVK